MIKAVIFDGGGTIWNSMEVLHNSYRWAFEQLGICKKEQFPFTVSQCNRLRGLKDFNTEAGIAKILLALSITKEDPDKILASKDANSASLKLVEEAERKDATSSETADKLAALLAKYLYEIFDDSKYPLCKGVKGTLNALKGDGFELALLSNRRRQSTLNILKAHSIDSLFSNIIAFEDQKMPKPSAEGVDIILKSLNLNEDEVLFVGDSAVDIISGKLAGLKAVGVLSGMADYRTLKNSGADSIINDLSGLLQDIRKFMR